MEIDRLTKDLEEFKNIKNWKELVILKGFRRPYIHKDYYRATMETIELLALGYPEETAIKIIIKRRKEGGKELDFEELERIVKNQLRFADWQKRSEEGDFKDEYKKMLDDGLFECMSRLDEENGEE